VIFGDINPADFATLQAATQPTTLDNLVARSPFPEEEVRRSIPSLILEGAIQEDTQESGSTYSITTKGQAVLEFAQSVEFTPGAPLGQGWVDYYSQGACHVFALAAHGALGGKGFLLVTDPFDLNHEAEDPDDNMPAVIHVYAIIERAGRDWAIDVFGQRPVSEVEREVIERYSQGIVACDEMSEHQLLGLVRNAPSDCRPLEKVTPAMWDKAREHLEMTFPDLLSENQSEPAPKQLSG
jgi:predicted transcriptional regulator